MIAVMAAVMAVQAALIYQVQNATAVAKSAGAAAAAMLFIYEGAFTIGFQATVWVSSACFRSLLFLMSNTGLRCILRKYFHSACARKDPQSVQHLTGS